MNVRVTSGRTPSRTELFSAIGVVGAGRALHVFARQFGDRSGDWATEVEVPLAGGVLLELDEEGAPF